MDIRLIRRPHTNQMVRASGIQPTDPYFEMCWLPVVGPSTVALVRHVAHVTADRGGVHAPMSDLGRQLGVGPVNVPSRTNRLIRTLDRAEQFGLAFSSFGAPGESMTFGIHNEIALIPNRLLDRLPTAARRHHLATVDAVNETLRAAGLPALRSRLPARDVAPPGPAPALAPAGHTIAPRPRLSTPERARRSHRSRGSRPTRRRARHRTSRCDRGPAAHPSRDEPPPRTRRARPRPRARSADSTAPARPRAPEPETGNEPDDATHTL